MYSFNRVSIIGYQTQPLSVRQTPSGASVVDLNLVVPYTFRPENGETLEGKGFHTVTLWGPMAEVAGRFLKPGGQVFISGRLQTDSWDDEKTGEKRSKTKIIGLDMILLDPKEGMRSPEGASSLRSSLNRAEVIGNVTRDPEIRTTSGGQNVLTLGIATNERWKDKSSGEIRERAEFHNVVVWGALAQDVAKTVKKGNRAYACGRVQTRAWETKDAQKRTTTEIIADQVQLLGMRHPVAETSIEAAALRQAQGAAPPSVVYPEQGRGATDEVAMSGSSSSSADTSSLTSSDLPVDLPVPEVAYASEIRVEDLPF